MTISIIICTRNRADSLNGTLNCITQVDLPDAWSAELIVLDNGSTDHTRRIAGSFSHPRIGLQYVYEGRAGKGYAYNHAMASAKGEVFLFTDDDVRPPVDWIEKMCRPILEGHADAVAGGVTFPPHIEEMMREEPLAQLRAWWACTAGLDRRAPHTMVGANMAFHRRVTAKVPGIDLELGPGALGFCDESLFSRQLREAGFSLIGVFDTAVVHHFDVSRLTRNGVLDSARKMGRSHAFVFHHWYHHRSRAALVRLAWAYARIKVLSLRDRTFRINRLGLSIQAVNAERDLAFCREYLRQSKRPHKYTLRGLFPRHIPGYD